MRRAGRSWATRPRSAGLRFALGAVALLVAATASAAEPSRIAVVRPVHPDAIANEATTRLRAELVAAGFAVILVDAEPGRDPRAEVEGAAASSRPFATVTIVSTGHGAVAEVWVADHVSHKTLVRRVDTGATAESSQPAALAIRAVELLRASLLEASAAASEARPADALPPDVARLAEGAPPGAKLPPPHRALLEGPSVELGLTSIYGLGDAAGRLAPTLRFAYGARMGLAGRFSVMGPTSTDQTMLLELAYGCDRSWQVIAPVVSVGAGAAHVHMDDTATVQVPRLRTSAWGAAFSASAGVAARATDRAAFLIDAHALLVQLGPGAIVGAAPAGGQRQLLVTASLGVVAGF